MRLTMLILGCSILTAVGSADPPKSAYVGQETREIKSLSADDIADLRHGRGWGLAKAAELNGVPGPLHVLELKEALALTPEQARRVESEFDAMRAEATRLGVRLIEQERALDRSFAEGTATEESLKRMLDEIAATLGELRYVHLAAHLKTRPILTPQQAQEYVRLRGYTGGDPCAAVPDGHDPEMWKRHHGCE